MHSGSDALQADAADVAAARKRPGDRFIIACAVVFAVLVLALQGAYVVGGSMVASADEHDADRAISTAIAHQDAMQDSFNDLGQNFSWLTSTNFNPTQLRPLADGFVLNWRTDGQTITTDDGALQRSERRLGGRSWLTLPSRGRIAHEASRISHARKALSALSEMASDLVKDGQFLQAYGSVAADFINAGDAGRANNEAQFASALSALVADATAALALSTGPGLPPEVHALVAAELTFARDARNALVSAGAMSQTDVNRTLNADIDAMSAVNTDKVPDDINAFYKPYIDRYHAEARAASH